MCHGPNPREIRHPSKFRDLGGRAHAFGLEGRQLQALVEEAFADLLEKRKKANPRAHVMGLYLASHEKYGLLYKKLAE